MKKLGNALARSLKNEDDPTAVEYAVMLALIIVVCIAAIELADFQGVQVGEPYVRVGPSKTASDGPFKRTKRGPPAC